MDLVCLHFNFLKKEDYQVYLSALYSLFYSESNFIHMAALNDGTDEDFTAILEAFKAHLVSENMETAM